MNKNYFINKFIIMLFALLVSNTLFTQESISVHLNWSTILTSKNQKDLVLPIIEGNGFINNKTSFEFRKQINFENCSFSIGNELYDNATVNDLDYLNYFHIEVPQSIEYSVKLAKEKGVNLLVFNCFPFISINGQIKRLINFELFIEKKQSKSSQKSNSTFKNQSVLSSGEWYKIPISKDGVYKIDFNFLSQMGINTSSISSNSIHIFGNGEGKLPELNSVYRTDDLAQNTIMMFDGGDGSFDIGDYFLFYGWGPDRWYYDSINTYRDKNVYSDFSYYFLTINKEINSLNISNSSLITNNNPSLIFNYYDDFQIHELDSFSIVKGGQRWYGELFDVVLEHDFKFDFNNLYSQNFKVNFAIASNAEGLTGNNLSVKINNQLAYSTSLPVGEYSRKKVSFNTSNLPSDEILKFQVNRISPSVLTYLDFIQLSTQKKIIFDNNQFNFRNFSSVGSSKISRFIIENLSSNELIWDVTNKHNPQVINFTISNKTATFNIYTDTLREFVVFNQLNTLIPSLGQKIKSQNLHSLTQTDLVIVTPKIFLNQANRLANLHSDEGLIVNVVELEQIYNEFSSGMQDPTAIKDLMRMFYKRGLESNLLLPKNLLLFGDGTYDPKDRISNNNNYIPTFQVESSEYLLSAMVTDDYFGMLDDNESIESTDLLDIGVGRLLISSIEIANQQVDKIEHYMKNGGVLDESGSCFGNWKNKYSIIADDEEYGYFIKQDAEPNSIYVKDSFPTMNIEKIYCDAYQQTSNAGGQRYPSVNNEITSLVQNGVLVMNYIGHGGEKGAAEERIITIPQIQDWTNKNTLNLFVSATCEFTKYDDPERVSAGEWISLNPSGGAIALMTTTRPVFFGVNTITGKTFYKYVFSRDSLNNPLTFGEIIRLTKNNSGASDNKRSFTLIGDPALKISLPRYKIVTDSINGYDPDSYVDTVRALSKVNIKGHFEDFNGNILPNFNGIVQPSVYDKALFKYTLGQDVSSPLIEFQDQNNLLFKGKASVKNGFFEFDFIVPKDINYQFGNGRISYYGFNSNNDATGVDENIIVGGIDTTGVKDLIGPEVKIYLNDSSFVDGGLTDENPKFIAQIFDQSGVNTVGNGIGHDMVLIIDNQTSNPIILNNYYSANLNTYQSGEVLYQLKDLAEGDHTLLFKVWDVNNNSSESRLNFSVSRKNDVALSHVLNYPNPFTTSTNFFFEHNQNNQEVQVQIQVFTVTGALVKTINKSLFMSSYRSEDINWDGLDDYGDKIATGVYLYKLTLKTSDGKTLSKIEKLFKI